MAVTNVENQHIELKKNIKQFYMNARCLKGEGICAVRHILAPSLDKWSLFCLYNLAFNDVLRFNALKNYIPGISSRMLSVTLKRLEEANLITRKIYPEVPPRVEYRLTKFGYGFCEKILSLNQWVLDQFQEEEVKVKKLF